MAVPQESQGAGVPQGSHVLHESTMTGVEGGGQYSPRRSRNQSRQLPPRQPTALIVNIATAVKISILFIVSSPYETFYMSDNQRYCRASQPIVQLPQGPQNQQGCCNNGTYDPQGL